MAQSVLKLLRTSALALALGLVVAAPAGAATPCWEDVINDWFQDGRVDKVYPIHCYQEAIDNLPQDAHIYSSAPDDISRALQDALRKSNGGGGGTTTTSSGGAVGGAPSGGGGPGTSGGAGGSGSAGTRGPGPAAGPSKPDEGIFRTALSKAAPSNANSIPLPLLILAGIAGLLLAAGSAGLVARRLQARRVRLGRRELPPSGRPPLPP